MGQSILGWFYIIMILLMTGITIFVAYIIIDTANSQTIWDDSPEAKAAINISQQTILNFDNVMLFVIIGMSLFVIISSAMIWQHPAFFIVGLVLLAIAITFSAIISNTFWDFSNTATVISTASNFPKIKFLMEKLPLYILFLGITASIVGYVSYTRQ